MKRSELLHKKFQRPIFSIKNIDLQIFWKFFSDFVVRQNFVPVSDLNLLHDKLVEGTLFIESGLPFEQMSLDFG